MATNTIIQSKINPIKFVLIEPQDIPQYISKHYDDWLFKNTIREFEQPTDFAQKWLMDDSIRLQYRSNFSPLTLKLFNCESEFVYSIPFETLQQDFFDPDFFIRQIELDIASLNLDAGLYFFTIPEAGWISEPQEFMDEDDVTDPTLLIEYSHHEIYGGLIFDIPFSPSIRTPSILKFKNPASKDVVYADQDEAESMLRSVPYTVMNFILGGRRGVPPYLIEKISRIFGCSSLKIDGRLYTKNEGAVWDHVEVEDYPLAGWSIELRDSLNRDSLTYDNETEIIGKAAMVQVIDSKGFGIDDEGEDFLEILNVE